MAITIQEAWDSGDLSDESGAKLYIIDGTSDEAAARATLEAGALSTLGNLKLDKKRCRVTRLADHMWMGNAVYREPEKIDEAGDTTFSFSTLGGTEHITHSLATINTYIPAWWGVAPDYSNAIGVSGKEVKGCDIERKSFEFSLRVVHAAGAIDATYIAILYALTKCFNGDPVTIKGHQFAAGELLFRGAEGDVKDDGSAELTYSFSGRPNETNTAIGDITVAAARGQDYVWVDFIETVNNGRIVKVPLAAFVEMVYEPGTFSGLKLS